MYLYTQHSHTTAKRTDLKRRAKVRDETKHEESEVVFVNLLVQVSSH